MPSNPLYHVDSLFDGDANIHSRERMVFKPRSFAESTNLWELTSHVYEPLWRHVSSHLLTGGTWSLDKECDMMSGWLSPKEDAVYLDIGSSTGVYGRFLLKRFPGIRMIFIDYSLPMLRKAKKMTGATYWPRTAFYQCDAASLPFLNHSVNGAVMGGTLNELTQPESVLSELKRVVKPGGEILVMHLIRKSKPGFVIKLLKRAGIWLPTTKEADALFHDSGLVIEDKNEAGVMRLVLCRA